MVKKVKLHDLCCANCAAKIEDKVSKLDGVESVTVNFLTEKMIMNADESKMEDILSRIEKIVHKIEPDVEIEYIYNLKLTIDNIQLTIVCCFIK